MGTAPQIEAHGNLLARGAVEGHRVFHPVHAAGLGGVALEQQLGFAEGFALLGSLLLPIAIELLIGGLEVALP